MDSTAAAAQPALLTNDAQATPWQRFAAYLARRRVRISLVVFLLLIAEDLIVGIRPHSIVDVHDWKSMVGLGAIGFGVALRSWAAGILHKNKQLTLSGPYEVIRHPLYVGSFLMMIGFCLLVDDWENIWIVIGPVLGFYILSTLREERSLAERFGHEWHSYARSVPRFLPHRLPRFPLRHWQLSQWTANREFRLVGGAILALIALQTWRLL